MTQLEVLDLEVLDLEVSDSIDSPLSAEARSELTPGLWIEEKQIPIAPATESQPASAPKAPGQFWKVFGTTFITIFLAELGDKTQVATLLMSAEFHAPWIVFTGAAAALITTSLLGVLVGRWLSAYLTPKTLNTAAGVTLALISAWLLLDAFKG